MVTYSKLYYGKLYEKFLVDTKIDRDLVVDYRPTVPPYFWLDMPWMIKVWLKDGSSIIYPVNEDGHYILYEGVESDAQTPGECSDVQSRE